MRSVRLLLDTSTKGALVALVEVGERPRVLTYQTEKSALKANQRLPDLLDNVLAKAQSRLNDIELITLGIGPGSFTGVRIGIAFVKGLALVHPHLRFQGSSALAMAARAAAKEIGCKVFYLPQTKTHGFRCAVDEDLKESLVDLRTFEEVSNEDGAVLGSWPVLASLYQKRDLKLTEIHEEGFFELVMAGYLMTLSGEESLLANFTNDVPKPRYMRRSTAEENLLRKSIEVPL